MIFFHFIYLTWNSPSIPGRFFLQSVSEKGPGNEDDMQLSTIVNRIIVLSTFARGVKFSQKKFDILLIILKMYSHKEYTSVDS